MRLRFFFIIRSLSILLIFTAYTFQYQNPVRAAATLTITPNTWNIIGLDSNTPASGPYRFPIGAKICSTVNAVNVTADFVWDDGLNDFTGDAYVNLRTGSLSSTVIPSILAGQCADAYFEVEVDKTAASFDQTRAYHITAADGSGTVSTPQPRELYVEHLISQNRNAITDIKLGGTSIPSGGTLSLMVGSVYDITLIGGTATQGYNQFESFINFPNTVFQILSVSTTYSADSNIANVPNPNPSLYANSCVWDNDPDSPTYRSCIGGDDKAGGSDVQTTYHVKIISGAGTTETLNTLLYDFSGSSFHYNSDYSTGLRYASILGPSMITIKKTFTPKAIAAGGTSVMTFKISNPTAETITGVKFADAFPSGMVVAGTPDVSFSGCGAGAFSPSLTGAETSISFANGTLLPNSICTINVNVTAPDGTYTNTTGHLYINTTTDTGNTGSDILTVASSSTACTPGQTLTTWTFAAAAGTGVPPLYTTKAANVSTAVLSYTGGTQSVNTTLGSPAVNSWEGSGFVKDAVNTSISAPYFVISVDTSKYSDVSISLRSYATSNWGTTNILKVWSSGGGATFSSTTPATGTLTKATWSSDQSFAAASTGAATTTFRINADGANPSGASMLLDNIVVTGCGIVSPAPTLAKSFLSDPIAKGATSTLRFTINNTAAANTALTGIAFSDVLPAGLSVATSSASKCGGTLDTNNSTRTIQLTGASLAAGASCTFDVIVTGTTEGQYDNVTGYISSTESGTSTNYATDSITVIAPPVIGKSFTPTSIFTNNTSVLKFVISNPNMTSSLSGVTFTDDLPAGLTVADSSSVQCGGTLTTTNVTPPNQIQLVGATISAKSTCTLSVTVTGISAGTKNNITSVVSSTEGGNGNTASASLVVADQVPSLDLTKQTAATASGPWSTFIGVAVDGDVYYRFKVYNSGDVNFTDLSISDPTLLALIPTIDITTCSWKDALGNSFTLPLIPGDTAYCVVGPTSAVAGLHSNTATVIGTYATGTVTSSSTAKYATPALTITKNVTPGYFEKSTDILTYGYVVKNTGDVPLLGPVTATDDKTLVTCGLVSSVGDKDNYLDKNEEVSCSASYTVTSADVTAGLVTNSAYATVNGVESPTVNKTALLAAITIDKDTTTPTISPNGTVIYQIVVNNTGADRANFQVTDTVPFPSAQFTVTNVVAAVTSGTITDNFPGYDGLSSGNNNLLAGTDTLLSGTTATITVTLKLTDASAGIFDNTATATYTGGSVDDNGSTANDAGTPDYGKSTPTDDPENDEDVQVVAYSAGMLKSIAATDQSFTAGSDVAIGEIITYSVSFDLSAGANYNNMVITDTMDSGLAFVKCDSVVAAGIDMTSTVCPTPPAAPAKPAQPVVSSDGGVVTFTIGDLAPVTNSTLVITYRVIVLDVVDNSYNDLLNNSVSAAWGISSTLTDSAPEVKIIEPDLAINKSASPSTAAIGAVIHFTLSISHTAQSSASAFDVEVNDALPAGLVYVPGTVAYSAGSLVPTSTLPANLGNPASSFTFIWDSFPLGAVSNITFDATLALPPVTNSASVAWTSLAIDPAVPGGPPTQLSVYNPKSTERWYDPSDPANIYGNTSSFTITAIAAPAPSGKISDLPETGFPPNVITALSEQPANKYYSATNLSVEIPSLGVEVPIVGVPSVDGKWDVFWLNDQSGWLNGTAFPGWDGNSVLTGHVYLPNGKPGPFVNIHKLKWGDSILVHAYGSTYTFEVRQNLIVAPHDVSVFKHEEKSWLTLFTCKNFNPSTNSYDNRIVVRSVLVGVK